LNSAWNKAITVRNNMQRGGGEGDTTDVAITMIPFARDSQYYVNSVLLFKTSNTDTSYQFLCDWQYALYGFDTSQAKWDARSVFHIFSEFEKSVFDHYNFIITDTRIFGDTVETIKVDFEGSDSSSGLVGRPSILTSINICTPYRICQTGGCLAFRTNGGIDREPVCCYPSYHTVCTTLWIEDGWIPASGGSGGGEPGGGGGGGNDGGFYTPPTCEGGSGRPNLVEPCTTGWYPLPLPSEITPLPDPTDSILARYSRAIKDTAIYIYDNLSQPNNEEYTLTGWLDNDLIKVYDVRTIHDSISVQPNLMFGQRVSVVFIWHSHVSRSDNPAQRGSFSPYDIDVLRTPRILRQDFISFADCRNKRYALVIKNVAKARAFFNSHTLEDLETLYDVSSTGDIQLQNENSIKNVIGTLGANGIGFYVSNDAPVFQSWTLLNP